MSRVSWVVLLCLFALPLSLVGCGDDDDSGSTNTGEGEGEGVASEMTDCEEGKLDSVTNLCWENPPSTLRFTWDEALTYCDDLTASGHDDWRLPKIQELISLIRGCVDMHATGDLSRNQCGVTDPGCIDHEDCWETGCEGCGQYAGPDDESDGCYWDPALAGECYSCWSSSSYASYSGYAWYVGFDGGYASSADKNFPNQVRCVRGGP
jgi:hypothetical protein